MADPEHIWKDVEDYGQDASSQANRTNFNPGKTSTGKSSETLDVNWPKEYIVKTGNTLFDNNVGIHHKRVYDYNGRIVCNQTFPTPNSLGSTTYTVTGDDGELDIYTIEDTTTQDNSGAREKSVRGEMFYSSSSSSSAP